MFCAVNIRNFLFSHTPNKIDKAAVIVKENDCLIVWHISTRKCCMCNGKSMELGAKRLGFMHLGPNSQVDANLMKDINYLEKYLLTFEGILVV